MYSSSFDQQASEKKEWISPKSETFEALQKIVLGKSVLKDLDYLTKFCHTGVLEVLYNKWTIIQNWLANEL